MAMRIVYQLPGEPVASLTPCNCGLTIDEIARQDVPGGVYFWFVEESVIPLDPIERMRWMLADELGPPAGVGERPMCTSHSEATL